jgi:cell division protein FtsB
MNKAEELVVEKVSELCHQIIKLQTENDCLKKENEFLKTLILKQNDKNA